MTKTLYKKDGLVRIIEIDTETAEQQKQRAETAESEAHENVSLLFAGILESMEIGQEFSVIKDQEPKSNHVLIRTGAGMVPIRASCLEFVSAPIPA